MCNTQRRTASFKCPHCGADYLPAEVYMPGAFLGRPDDLVKDSFGKIIYEDFKVGQEPNMTEHYICDYCNNPFIIEALITYKTKEEAPERDFSTQYVSLLD